MKRTACKIRFKVRIHRAARKLSITLVVAGSAVQELCLDAQDAEDEGEDGAAQVEEELARVDVSSACTFNSHASCAILIGAVGDEEQQARLFGRIVNEGALVSLALTEPEAGSDAASLRTAAVADGDRYVLNGVKHYCTNADFAEFLLVFAATPRADGSRPISVFVVGKDNPGLHIRRWEKKMIKQAKMQGTYKKPKMPGTWIH